MTLTASVQSRLSLNLALEPLLYLFIYYSKRVFEIEQMPKITSKAGIAQLQHAATRRRHNAIHNY